MLKSISPGAVVAAVICAALVLLAAHGPKSLESIVRIGVNHSPPYSMIGPDGVPSGFTVAVLDEAARRRGIHLQWVAANEGPDVALASGKVSVWSLVTDIPRRHGHIFFTDPYVRTNFALLTRKDAGIARYASASGRRIAHADNANVTQLAAHFFTRSVLIPAAAGEEIAAVCAGRADGAFLELKEMLDVLLTRPAACRAVSFGVLPVDGASFDMAVGSTRAGEAVARSLRTGISEMSRDGTLSGLYRTWLRDTSDETRIVNDLMDARERSRMLGWGLGLLAAVISLLTWMMYRKKLAQEAIKEAYEFASVALDGAGGLVVICNRRGEILRFNRSCERASGKPLDDVRGKPAWDVFVPPNERALVQSMYARLAAGTGETNHEHHWETLEGCRLFSWSNTTLKNPNGKVEYIIATGVDITAREEVEDRLSYEATHDPLTNLANRRHFMRQLDEAAAAPPEIRQGFSVALGDLDKFKLINDTYGHAAGDAVLVRLAKLIREEIGPDDVAGRLGGDEFSLLLRGSFPGSRIDRIRARLGEEEFVSANGSSFRASVTFGIAHWNVAGDQPSALLHLADEALYRAKRVRNEPPFESPPPVRIPALARQ